MISFDDFKKIEIKLRQILSAEKIPDTDKLLRLSVDFGPVLGEAPEGEEEKHEIRQIVSGISLYFPEEKALIGKKCMFVTNLEPRTIRGFESQGMILALSTGENNFSLLIPEGEMPIGIKVR
jgi:methionine--tRNA ligase beta chain